MTAEEVKGKRRWGQAVGQKGWWSGGQGSK